MGLGAPYWNPYAGGIMAGITRGTAKNHIVRAGLQSMAYQANDLISAMVKDSGIKIKNVRVDGGASANNYLCQFQADLLNVPVIRPAITETTALGAAYAAGLAVDFWTSLEELKQYWAEDRAWQPHMDDTIRQAGIQGWKKAVQRTFDWAV